MSRMIQCKICGEEIAANAKTCPKCGAKNKKPFYTKWWVWLIAAILVISLASGTGNDTEKKENTEASSGAQTNAEMYEIGDVVTTDKFETKVTSVNVTDSVGSEYLSTTPSEGGIFVVVEWECKNISKKPVSSFSCPSIYLEDSEAVEYDSDLDATTYYATGIDLDRKILSDLNPGINVKDAQVFEISKEAYDAGGFSVKIDADSEFNVKIN